MKKFSFLILLTVILFSCDKSDDDSTGKNLFSEYVVHENSALKISESEIGTILEIVDGDHLVFEYTSTQAGDPQIADSGYKEYLYFEMPAGTEDFQLASDSFDERNTFVKRSCFCVVTDFRRVTSGEIIAQKTGDMEWTITFNVAAAYDENGEDGVFSGSLDIEDSGLFKPE